MRKFFLCTRLPFLNFRFDAFLEILFLFAILSPPPCNPSPLRGWDLAYLCIKCILLASVRAPFWGPSFICSYVAFLVEGPPWGPRTWARSAPNFFSKIRLLALRLAFRRCSVCFRGLRLFLGLLPSPRTRCAYSVIWFVYGFFKKAMFR